jgi:iron complex transport system substrate-binding protein
MSLLLRTTEQVTDEEWARLVAAITRRRFLGAGAGAALVTLDACGGSADTTTDSSATGAGTRNTGRVVALGEEFLLADLLALGIEPVASTATVVDSGFQGVDEFDTTGIEALSSTNANLEQLAALRPDTIVTTQFVVDEVGRDRLDALGNLIVIPAADPETQLRALADAFGRTRAADRLLAELADAHAAALRTIGESGEECRVSVATIYPAQLAVWVDGPINIPQALLDLGCALVPSASDIPAASNGRAYISFEQIGLLDAPMLVMMQSSAVAGETAAYDEVTEDPLWQALPAVTGGKVIELDRLGYPGTPGQIRLFHDLAAQLGNQ